MDTSTKNNKSIRAINILSQIEDRLLTFGSLPNNWDSYGANPISEKALKLCRNFTELLSETEWFEKINPSSFFPDPSDMIVFIFNDPNHKKQIWEFSGSGKDGKVGCSLEIGDDAPPLSEDLNEKDPVSWIKKFLDNTRI